MGTLDGRIALITGSSRGIGQAIARCFARHGARVVLHGRDNGALQQAAAEIAAGGGRAVSVTGDVTKLADIERMRQQIESDLGPVDILVACAGGSFTRPGPVEEMTEAGWHAAVDGNLTATFLTLKVFLPGMKQRRTGTIITISSSAARRPTPNAPAPYAAAKAGIIVLTQLVAAQAGPFGIRANCIAPETIPPSATCTTFPRRSRRHWPTSIH